MKLLQLTDEKSSRIFINCANILYMNRPSNHVLTHVVLVNSHLILVKESIAEIDEKLRQLARREY
jgi:uncharacterized protein YlzI (FlbEa/FlbD family)